MKRKLVLLFFLTVFGIAVVIGVLRAGPDEAVSEGAESAAVDYGDSSTTAAMPNAIISDSEGNADITPEYPVDIPPIELTQEEKLTELIHYAQNRYNSAAVPGYNILTGRHSLTDISIFSDAIEAAQAALESGLLFDEQTLEAIDALQEAITAFKNAIIDPDNRYKPFLQTIAHGEDVPQKRHLRAVWIATVVNIDWPSAAARGTAPAHVDMQKSELRARFHEIADLGFNAVVFQISPTSDAMFHSQAVPWSAWLTGETNFKGDLRDSNGDAFDPLQYAIDLAQAHNIELPAWFNPYRVTHLLNSYIRGDGIRLSSTGGLVSNLAQIRKEGMQIPNSAFALFGDYVKLGEDRYVVDPAVPEVREWIVQRVLEVVENYDIDAVQFDDYFYPADYMIDDTFARYNTAENNWISSIAFPDTPLGRADWRRENTEMMIREVSAAIKEAKPWVKFGISPGGVWKSAAEGNTGLDGGGYDDGTGSASTTTWSNYHSSFADTRKWVIENFIDYLTPQIYWDWTLELAPYGVIAEWWGRLFFDYGPEGHLRNSHGKHTNAQLYMGLGLYRMEGRTVPKWSNAPHFENEGRRTFLRQEAYSIGNPNISGSMIFSQNQMRYGSENGMWETMQALRNTLWRYPALVPAMPHLGGRAPVGPRNVTTDGSMIRWENAETSNEPLVKPRYFVIYRGADERVDRNNPANIVAIVPAIDGQIAYAWEIKSGVGAYHYVVTAVNRLHDESW